MYCIILGSSLVGIHWVFLSKGVTRMSWGWRMEGKSVIDGLLTITLVERSQNESLETKTQCSGWILNKYVIQFVILKYAWFLYQIFMWKMRNFVIVLSSMHSADQHSLGFGFLHRILSCFKLNPFEYLNLSFDSSIDDVKKQYRKVMSSYCSGLS